MRRGLTVKKFLQCALVNARSIQCNMYIIQHHIVCHNLDVVAITESWLREDSGDDILRELCPAGYSSLHKPRIGKRGGGVAIIFRDTVRVRPLNLDFVALSFEFLAASLTTNSTCFTLLVIYRPPSHKPNQFIDEFASLLEFLVHSPGLLLIVGDFNIHVDDKSCQLGQSFLSLIDSFDLQQHVSDSSHVGGHTLDLVLSRSSDNFLVDCSTSDFISDHRAIHWCAKAHRPLRPVKKVEFRKLKSIDFSSFCSDLLKLPLLTSPAGDCESALLQYNNGLACVLDSHAPMVKRCFTVRPDNPWDNEEIHAARRKVRRLERRWKLTNLTIDKQIMHGELRNLHEMINLAKRSFLESQILEAGGKKTSLFKLVDSLLLVKPGLRLPTHDSLTELVEQFSHFFVSKINTIRENLDAAAGNWEPETRQPVVAFSSFSPVTVCEISSLILSCASKSSPLDPLPTFVLKKCLPSLAPSIANIINLSLSSGVFPQDMKLALITPLLKKHGLDSDVLSNYRPVSLLSFLSKLLERVAAKQLVAYLESQSLFASVQSAYRAAHSTETALLKVLNDLLTSVDNGDAVILALLDQSAAFDTIDHGILLDRLSARFGVSGLALTWFTSYLDKRQQSVSVNGVSSSPTPLIYGVPQGSVLGPILYILYNSPMHEIASSFGISDHYFADDSQEYDSFTPSLSAADQQRVFDNLTASLVEQGKWLAANRLKLNEDKTDALLVSSKDNVAKKRIASIPLVVGGASIIPSPVVRNLGVLLDSHLTMEQQINSSCRSSYFHLRRIARIKKFLSLPAVIQLVHAFVLSHIDYGNALLVGLPATRLAKLQRVQNSAARLIMGVSRRESITPVLRSLHWLPVCQRIEFKIAVQVFRCLVGLAPQYLSALISIRDTGRESRSSFQLLLFTPRSHMKSFGDRAFSVASPRIWNSLPPDLRLLALFPYSPLFSLTQFRCKLKTFLFRTAYEN